MPPPATGIVCITLPKEPPKCALPFPGGIELPSFGPLGDELMQAFDGLKGFSIATAPLRPFFDLLKLVMQIVKCIQAIPESILTLNPAKLIQCLSELLELLSKVIGWLPPVALPKALKELLCFIIKILTGLAALLEALADALEKLQGALEIGTGLGDPKLIAIAACAENNVTRKVEEATGLLEEVNKALVIYNALAEIAQFPGVKLDVDIDTGDVTPAALRRKAQIMRDAAVALTIVYNTLPG